MTMFFVNLLSSWSYMKKRLCKFEFLLNSIFSTVTERTGFCYASDNKKNNLARYAFVISDFSIYGICQKINTFQNVRYSYFLLHCCEILTNVDNDDIYAPKIAFEVHVFETG